MPSNVSAMSRLRRRDPRRLSVRFFSFGETKIEREPLILAFLLLLPFHVLTIIRQRLLHGPFFFFFCLIAFGHSNV